MNNRLKFRVWNKHINEYCNIQNLFILPTGETGYFITDGSYPPQRKFMRQEDMIIEMCTGLKDKNGNLIYEGDIIKCGGEKGIVKFGFYRRSDEHFPDSIYGFYIEWNYPKCHFRKDFGYWVTEERIEIIGNIHEQAEQKDVK